MLPFLRGIPTHAEAGGGSRVRGGVERKGLVRKEEEDRVDGG